VQRRKAVLVSSTRIPGARISYVQLSGLKSAQFSVGARRAGTQDKIFGALISLLMQMKFVGMRPPLSPAQRCADRQMEVMALAHWRDSKRRFEAERPTNRTMMPSAQATPAEKKITRRLLITFDRSNAGTERCGRPSVSELVTGVARPHSLQ
jgi:hypothetical protein